MRDIRGYKTTSTPPLPLMQKKENKLSRNILKQCEKARISRSFVWIGIVVLLLVSGAFNACRAPMTIDIPRNKVTLNARASKSDCTKLIASAIKQARSNNIDTLLFSKGRYSITLPITPMDSLYFLGKDKEEVIINQQTWGYPAFDVYNASNVTVSNMTLLTTQPRKYPNGFVSRGTDGFVNNAGIYSNSHSGTYTQLSIKGFTCGIHLSAWDGTGLYEQKNGNLIINVNVDSVDFGVLATGQKNLSIQGLTGTYVQQEGSGAAPHLIYISDANDPAHAWTENFSISNCEAIDGIGGHAYQVGTARNGRMTNLRALRCTGILAVKNFVDVVIDTLVALEDHTHEVGSVFIQPLNVENIRMRNVTIESTNPKARLMRLDGKNNRYSDIFVQTPIDHVDDLALITVEGENSSISNVYIKSLYADAGAIGVRLQGKQLHLDNIECNFCRAGFTIAQGCQDCSAVFDSKKIGAPKHFKEFAFYYSQSTTSSVTDQARQ